MVSTSIHKKKSHQPQNQLHSKLEGLNARKFVTKVRRHLASSLLEILVGGYC